MMIVRWLRWSLWILTAVILLWRALLTNQHPDSFHWRCLFFSDYIWNQLQQQDKRQRGDASQAVSRQSFGRQIFESTSGGDSRDGCYHGNQNRTKTHWGWRWGAWRSWGKAQQKLTWTVREIILLFFTEHKSCQITGVLFILFRTSSLM